MTSSTDLQYRPAMILIMDGYGMRAETEGNAVAAAQKPHLDRIFAEYPRTEIHAGGEDVGLPDGQMGNSEVGHLNIGAGRVVYQDLTRISKAIASGEFEKNEALNQAMDRTGERGTALHLMGLVSDGGVHSHQNHLYALLKMAKKKGLKNVCIHAFLDGRDVPPRSAAGFLAHLEDQIRLVGVGQVVLISGRYYAMDRDKRWERVQKAYEAMTVGNGPAAPDAVSAIQAAFDRGENDEFVLPTNIYPQGGEPITVQDDDTVIFFNFRPDRAREITRCFVDPDFDGFPRKRYLPDLFFVCLTQYDVTMPGVLVAFPPQPLKNTLGEYLSGLGLKQLRIAETEKYAHVTFFFNGGVEAPNPGEDRVLIDSPKVPTYDMQPEMSAYLVTDRVIREIQGGKYDVIILNFANPDMVGHTGIMNAAVRAIEAVDDCVGRISDAVLAANGQILLTADHGNAEKMLEADGSPVTAHSTNPVPLVCIRKDAPCLLPGGRLSDLAPTLLDLMGIPQPEEMTGRSLVAR